MKFSLSILAAFAATVMGQATTGDFDPVSKPEMNQKIPAGQTFEIVWDAIPKYAEGTIKITLIGGETQGTQQPIKQVAAGIPNSAEKFAWAVDANLGDAKVYGLELRYEQKTEIFQYSNPFHIVKASGGKGDTTTTISKSYGEKTVTLSSHKETPTVTPHTSTPTPITTPAVNSTSTYVKPTTIKTKPAPIQTTTSVQTVPQPSKPATVPTEGAGARFGASSVALVGAFVVAAFAL